MLRALCAYVGLCFSQFSHEALLSGSLYLDLLLNFYVFETWNVPRTYVRRFLLSLFSLSECELECVRCVFTLLIIYHSATPINILYLFGLFDRIIRHYNLHVVSAVKLRSCILRLNQSSFFFLPFWFYQEQEV